MKFVIEPDGEVHDIGAEGYEEHGAFLDELCSEGVRSACEEDPELVDDWIMGTIYNDDQMWVGGSKSAFRKHADAIYNLALDQGAVMMDVHILEVPDDPSERYSLIVATPDDFRELSIDGLIQRARFGGMAPEAAPPAQASIEGYMPSGRAIRLGDRRPVHVREHRRSAR